MDGLSSDWGDGFMTAAPTLDDPGIVDLSSWIDQQIFEVTPMIQSAATPGASGGNFSWSNDFFRNVSELIKLGYSAKQADAMTKINVARARQGLPLLDPSYLAPQVNVGMSPDVKNLLLYGGIALAAALILPDLLKR